MSIARTATARRIESRDVEALIAGETLTMYSEEFPGLYKAREVRATNGRRGIKVENVYRVKRDERGDFVHSRLGGLDVDRDDLVGHVVSCDVMEESGAYTGQRLATSDEAMFEHALKGSLGDASKAMEAVDRMGTYLVADEEGEEITLISLYGSKVTLTLYVEDDEHHETLAGQVEQAIHNAIPKAVIPKIRSKVVLDERRNVSTSDGSVLGIAVLADSTGIYTEGHNAFQTTALDPREVAKVRGRTF